MESPEPTDDDTVMTTKTNNENAENTQSAVSEDRRPSLFDAIWPWATRGEDQFTNQIKLRAAEALETERKTEELDKAEEDTSVANKIAMFEMFEMHEEKNIFVKEIERIKSLKENNAVKEAEVNEAKKSAEIAE